MDKKDMEKEKKDCSNLFVCVEIYVFFALVQGFPTLVLEQWLFMNEVTDGWYLWIWIMKVAMHVNVLCVIVERNCKVKILTKNVLMNIWMTNFISLGVIYSLQHIKYNYLNKEWTWSNVSVRSAWKLSHFIRQRLPPTLSIISKYCSGISIENWMCWQEQLIIYVWERPFVFIALNIRVILVLTICK